MDALPALSLAEWIVLALIDEQPRHGFAVATLTGDDGDLGRVWQVPRPVVYRAITTLTDAGLLIVEATERGRRGPRRSVLASTDIATDAVRRWLGTPVGHVREARSELLVKLALLGRRRLGNGALVAAQRRVFARIVTALEAARRGSGPDGSGPDGSGPGGSGPDEDFGSVLAVWRLENARAALRFLDDLAG